MKSLIFGVLLAVGLQCQGAEGKAEPLPQLSAAEAARLEQFRGVHPRLFVNAQKRDALRAAVKTTHAALWKMVKDQADAAVRKGPPKYRSTEDSSGDEQLWQRDVGNAMPGLAIAWLITGDRRYLESARAWALASAAYPTWGLGVKRDGHDLAAGHQLFGIALVYDWCYQHLDAQTRQTLRAALEKRGAVMAKGVPGSRNVLQNHLWVDACGLATAGLAIFDEAPVGREWVAITLSKWRRTHEALGEDGASHEGAAYWSYGVEYLLKFMWLAREQLGVNFYDHPWWRNTADYRLYCSLPRQAWTKENCIVDIADSPRSGYSYGPDYLLRALAHEYRDGHAQWLAAELDATGVSASAGPWMNLIWYDPAIKPKPPADLPTLRHFDDMELVSARSSWAGDESLVFFKCGPFIGHKAVQMFDRDPGGGHVHPDANHFVLFGSGEWLIRDDGYRTKATSQHNTLLIDGHGQLGEGSMWFDGHEPLKLKAQPRVLRAESTPALDLIVGDAAQAYARTNGLKRFVRHLVFLKPNVLIVADDIALDTAHQLELRFHPEVKTTREADGAFRAAGKAASLRLEPLTLTGVAVSAKEDSTTGQHGKSTPGMFSIRLSTKQTAWRNAVALSWAGAGAAPAKVQLKEQGNRWTFNAAGRDVTLDWADGSVRTGK